MAGNSDGKAENHAEENWIEMSASDSSTRALPSLSTTSRSITPKGPLFTNLGEAHQAITSKLASRSAGHDVPDPSSQPSGSTSFVNVSPSSTGEDDSQPIATHVEFARPNYPSEPSLMPFSGPLFSVADSARAPTDPSPVVSSLASSSRGNSVETGLHTGDGRTYFMSDPSGSGETIEVVYDQSYPPPLFAQSTSSATVHQSQALRNDEALSNTYQNHLRGAAQSAHVRSTDLRRANTDVNRTMNGWHMYPHEDEHPPNSLPELRPKPDVPKKNPARANKGTPNFSRPSDNNPGETSNVGGSTDSDEDPFKYDRGSFTVFLQPSREREVSAALRCVSGDSTASASGLLHLSPSPEPPAAARGFQSNNPFAARLQSYQTPAVGYDWGGEDGPNEVRIPVLCPPPSVPPNSPVQQAAKLHDFVQGQGGQRPRKDIRTIMSDQADWETVATSVGQFDSNRALASSTGLSGSHPVNATGSSIADYSDTSSVHVPQFDVFPSTDKMREGTTTNHPLDTHGRRILNDAGRPVFPHQPRVHRVNGYLQNPRRMFTDTITGSSGASVRSALVERLTASIRTRNARKQAHRQNSQLRSEHQSRAGGFKLLESISSTYSDQAIAMDRLRAVSTQENIISAVGGCKKQQGQETTFGLLTSPIPKEPAPIHPKGHQPTQSNHTQRLSDFESPTLFSFPLITLQEAARRAALRAQNDDDHTVTSGARTRKNSSMDSSKATQRTTPPTPHLMKPVRTHSHQNLIMGHERGISNVTSYKSATPLVAGRSSALSRTFQNPFEPVGGGVQRNTQPYPGHNYIFDAPPTLVPRDKRNAARAAAATGLGHNESPSLHQIAALEAGASFGALAAKDDSVYLSWEARKRREAFYYVMCALAVFPFFVPLFWFGKFDSALSWMTRGEAGSLTRRQRSRVLAVGVVFSFVWVVGIAVGCTVAALQAHPEWRPVWRD
ncbi:hypothetical protein N658DRAFT_472685 [Parathielavia hyrcaniae]|uniref:Uncharacterized protein n=1 Tax=Parathielavia hyrcaniae TaxID=113614 RepID=A0AAN6PZ65_9PEZI|nr:hypothetical protein N658DRAFT_472685 [Parathielavia hyrcaniae]